MTATVQLIERLGDGRESESEFLHLIEIDEFSNDPYGFADHAIRTGMSGAPTYSMERWFRWRFEQPFSHISDIYFWTPGLVVPEGWTVKYGTSENFAQPTNAPSSIATLELPTSKPEAPNAGGVPPLEGTETRYSDWIVLQASVNSDAAIGPMLGFDNDDAPVAVEYRLDWTES